MSDKNITLEDILQDILNDSLNLIFKMQLQQFEKTKKELHEFVEKIKNDNPRPETPLEGRITRSQTEKRKAALENEPGPSQSDDLDAFIDKSLKESLAKLDIWAENKKRIHQREIRNGLDVIYEAADEALNIATNQSGVTRATVIVPDAASAIFQVTNTNPVVGAAKKLGARPKEPKPMYKS